MSNIKRFVHKRILAKFRFMKKMNSTGVSFEEFCEYFYFMYSNDFEIKYSTLFGKRIKRNNTFWFVQNVEEVFIDEVYKFNTEENSPVILDCGSNIGLSIIYFKRMYPNAKIIGFEPDSVIYETCKFNLHAFGYDDVEVINSAVWNEDAVISFLPDNCLGGKVVEPNNDDSRISQITAVRLKDYLKNKIDFLKIDIEGAEYKVLEDCKDNLGAVERIFVEYHSKPTEPQALQNLLLILSNAGFRYYISSAWTNMTHPYDDFKNLSKEYYDMQLNIFAYRELKINL